MKVYRLFDVPARSGNYLKNCFERVCHVQHAGRFFLFDTVMLCSDHQNKVIRDYWCVGYLRDENFLAVCRVDELGV